MLRCCSTAQQHKHLHLCLVHPHVALCQLPAIYGTPTAAPLATHTRPNSAAFSTAAQGSHALVLLTYSQQYANKCPPPCSSYCAALFKNAMACRCLLKGHWYTQPYAPPCKYSNMTPLRYSNMNPPALVKSRQYACTKQATKIPSALGTGGPLALPLDGPQRHACLDACPDNSTAQPTAMVHNGSDNLRRCC